MLTGRDIRNTIGTLSQKVTNVVIVLKRLAGIVVATLLLVGLASRESSTSSVSSVAASATTSPSGGTVVQASGLGAGEAALGTSGLSDEEITAENNVDGVEWFEDDQPEELAELLDALNAIDPRESGPYAAPDWLGETLLEDREKTGQFYETPPELVNRQIATIDVLPPPTEAVYEATISEVTDEILERSTYRSSCPVTPDELRYMTITHYGFDRELHTGELLIHRDAADGIAEAFEKLFEIRYPIEETRIDGFELVDSNPTGDQNITTGFVCRASTVGSHWSEHAFGLAIDINPFQNPYVKGSLLIPHLAEAYLDRDRDAAGIIRDSDVVVEAFADMDWDWGGNWQTASDYMHFSHNGR